MNANSTVYFYLLDIKIVRVRDDNQIVYTDSSLIILRTVPFVRSFFRNIRKPRDGKRKSE